MGSQTLARMVTLAFAVGLIACSGSDGLMGDTGVQSGAGSGGHGSTADARAQQGGGGASGGASTGAQADAGATGDADGGASAGDANSGDAVDGNAADGAGGEDANGGGDEGGEETPPDEDGVVHVTLGSCARHASCALTGTEPGQHHPTLTVANRTFQTGEVIELSYGNPTFGSGDWITIVPRDFEDNSWCAWFWSANASGTHRFEGLPAGDYELRAYYGWQSRGECEVVARTPVKIRD